MELPSLVASFLLGVALMAVLRYWHAHKDRRTRRGNGCSMKEQDQVSRLAEPIVRFPVHMKAPVCTDSQMAKHEMDESPQSTLPLQLYADNLLTLLGAPTVYPGEERRMTLAERVEWLQAKMG